MRLIINIKKEKVAYFLLISYQNKLLLLEVNLRS